MKRAIPLFVVLVGLLSALLYWRLRAQRLEAERPSGGSATVEGTKVDVVSRLPGRLATVLAQAGDHVDQGQLVAELECAEQRAALSQAAAAAEAARVALEATRMGESLAQEGAKGAQSQVWVAKSATAAAQAQKLALEVQRQGAERAQQRVEQVHGAGAVSDQTLDQSEIQLAGLDHQLTALDANVDTARARSAAATSQEQAAVIQTKLASVEIRGAEQRLKMAEAARDQAAIAAGECRLLAPRVGYVQERNFEPG